MADVAGPDDVIIKIADLFRERETSFRADARRGEAKRYTRNQLRERRSRRVADALGESVSSAAEGEKSRARLINGANRPS